MPSVVIRDGLDLHNPVQVRVVGKDVDLSTGKDAVGPRTGRCPLPGADLEQQNAIATGFGVSLGTFGYGALLGLLGWIGLELSSERKRS